MPADIPGCDHLCDWFRCPPCTRGRWSSLQMKWAKSSQMSSWWRENRRPSTPGSLPWNSKTGTTSRPGRAQVWGLILELKCSKYFKGLHNKIIRPLDVSVPTLYRRTCVDTVCLCCSENEALWREVASLRQKHSQQQKVVNKVQSFASSSV